MYHRHAAYLFDLIPDFLVKHYPRPETKCSIRETTAYHEEGHILIVINYDLELERCEINENGRGAKIEIKEPENDIPLFAKYLLAGLISQHLFVGKFEHIDYCKDFAVLVCLEGLSLRDACDILGETVPEILEAETLIKSIATDLIKKNELLPADILRYRT